MLRRLALIIVFAITAMAAATAGAGAFDRVSTAVPGLVAGVMDAACARCSDEATPGAHPDHRNCGDCIACGALSAIEPQADAGSPLRVTAAVVATVYTLSPGDLDPHDPPPPRA